MTAPAPKCGCSHDGQDHDPACPLATAPEGAAGGTGNFREACRLQYIEIERLRERILELDDELRVTRERYGRTSEGG